MRKNRYPGRYGVCVLLFSALTSAADAPWPGEEWPTSDPAVQGVDPQVIERIVSDMRDGVYGRIDYFLLIRNGHVIADYAFDQEYGPLDAGQPRYQYNYDDPDWHPFYRDTELHSLQSVTKSVTSAALGIAVEQGHIESIEARAMSYFEDYDHDLSDPRKQAMTIRDLLMMRSGIEWNTEGGYDASEHSTVLLENDDEWIQFILNQPMDAEPGTVYEYNDGASVLLGKIITEATGQRADKWTAEKLFAPIGIDNYYWKISPDGEVDTEGGLYLTPHDLARIGYLFMNNGVWDGERLLSQAWIEASVSPLTITNEPDDSGLGRGYGYQWWVRVDQSLESQYYMGNGYGGQFLVVVPDYDLVAVFNGWSIHGEGERPSWPIVEELIIPALDTAR